MSFATRLLAWFDVHGRHDLPWQHPRSPYQVWVSEIMLQQTQVQTVIPYFERFMQRFPDIKALALAEQDEVLAHWAGLGYYARGRNLHKAAQIIDTQHGGEFPDEFDAIIALPGIGRSTAGAILSQAFEQRYAILDGNVKRVLTRHAAIEGWPGNKKLETELWQLAEDLTPQTRFADYTQAMMDLGATLCKRTRPGCEACPLQQDCQAYQAGRVAEFPYSKPKKTKPIRQAWFLLLFNSDNQIALIQRPNSGIWGGLYSLPEFDSFDDLSLAGVDLNSLVKWSGIRHTFSHYHLEMMPVYALKAPTVAEPDPCEPYFWLTLDEALKVGLPAPIKTLLQRALKQTVLEAKPFGDIYDTTSTLRKI